LGRLFFVWSFIGGARPGNANFFSPAAINETLTSLVRETLTSQRALEMRANAPWKCEPTVLEMRADRPGNHASSCSSTGVIVLWVLRSRGHEVVKGQNQLGQHKSVPFSEQALCDSDLWVLRSRVCAHLCGGTGRDENRCTLDEQALRKLGSLCARFLPPATCHAISNLSVLFPKTLQYLTFPLFFSTRDKIFVAACQFHHSWRFQGNTPATGPWQTCHIASFYRHS